MNKCMSNSHVTTIQIKKQQLCLYPVPSPHAPSLSTSTL